MTEPLWAWFAFIGFVFAMLAIDLGVFQRKAHVVKPQEAALWTGVWVSLSLLLGLAFNFWLGPEKAIQYVTGYVLEWSLSVDNIFVFVLVFSYFKTPFKYQQRVLLWGIVGALLLRGIMIVVGATLIQAFSWVLYIFGAFLLFTGARMLFQKGDGESDLEKNPALRLVKRLMPVSAEYDGQKFFTIRNGVRMATPLLLVLVVIEFTDLLFAVDSIPAIFAVTTDGFIVFTASIMAVLGLRSMYFLLAHVVHRFVYLKTGLAIILVYIGAKMLLLDVLHIPSLVSLAVVVGILALSVVASLIWGKPQAPAHQDSLPPS
ncbi:MAG: TerC family protein [Trueperaceae bacterium]|nr:TerC family protein [Trueperaceae bacterium]MCO5172595.1 TerC family protein [Trueperaceae bacterium]MCW5819142.1 TerC family protein [Trueperaceae bacterium]